MNANQMLKYLLSQLLKHGEEVPSRVGNTKELTFQSFAVTDPQNRYITLPERHVSVPAQIAETMWVLAGRNDIEWLSAYLPQAPKFADDGKHWRAGYGPRLRSFQGGKTTGGVNDQLTNVIDLLRKDPTTRRAVISLWDPSSDYPLDSKDIPCNNWLHFLARDGKLHLNIAIRSNDVMWGWSGINFFEWSVLLEIVAKYTGLQVGSLHFNVSSMHLYERHYEKAKRIVEAPLVAHHAKGDLVTYGAHMDSVSLNNLQENIDLWFHLEAEIREGKSHDIQKMQDPLLWSWLWAIAYYWGHEKTARMMLTGLDILPALEMSPKRKQPVDLDGLVSYMQKLHTEKSAAYGDSWKKRGELFSIIPNIARKVDRILAQTETSDETKLDTAMDLVIYLAKYRCWINNLDSRLEDENLMIEKLVKNAGARVDTLSEVTETSFDHLVSRVESHSNRDAALTTVTAQAVGYLVKLWSGPEGRSLRNEKRSWNPDPSVPQLQNSGESPSRGLMQVIGDEFQRKVNPTLFIDMDGNPHAPHV